MKGKTLFKNRAFQVKLVHTDEDGKTTTPTIETSGDMAAFAADIAKDLIKTAVVAVVIYVAADTARQVIVEKVSN